MSFVPVRVTEAALTMRPADTETIEILLSGGCRVRFSNAVSRPLLREVIAMLRR